MAIFSSSKTEIKVIEKNVISGVNRLKGKFFDKSTKTKIVCQKCDLVFDSEEEPMTTIEKAKTVAAGSVGGYVGSSMGIAALGTAISGLLPLAVVGAGAVYLLKGKRFKCPNCNHVSEL